MATKVDERWSPLLPPDDPATHRDYKARTRVRRYKGTSWYLAHLPVKQSAQIKARFGKTARGWGSIRVHLRIGDTEWDTSLFPDKKSGTYLFAIKAAVRKAEGIDEGDRITAIVHIV